jgi:hypothetical protein
MMKLNIPDSSSDDINIGNGDELTGQNYNCLVLPIEDM